MSEVSRPTIFTRTITLVNAFASFPGLGLRTSSDLLTTPNTVLERRELSLGSLDGTSARVQPLPTILDSFDEPSRDPLYTASTSSTRLPVLATSTIKAFRRALSFVENPKQSSVRDREAIIARARCRSRRRSDAAEDRAAVERATSLGQWPHRRASL